MAAGVSKNIAGLRHTHRIKDVSEPPRRYWRNGYRLLL